MFASYPVRSLMSMRPKSAFNAFNTVSAAPLAPLDALKTVSAAPLAKVTLPQVEEEQWLGRRSSSLLKEFVARTTLHTV